MDNLNKQNESAVQILVTAEVKAGSAAAFEEQFHLAAGFSRQEAGNRGYRLFKVVDKENNYIVMERYASQQAFAGHMAMPYTQELMKALAALLTHPVPEGLMILDELYPA